MLLSVPYSLLSECVVQHEYDECFCVGVFFFKQKTAYEI